MHLTMMIEASNKNTANSFSSNLHDIHDNEPQSLTKKNSLWKILNHIDSIISPDLDQLDFITKILSKL